MKFTTVIGTPHCSSTMVICSLLNEFQVYTFKVPLEFGDKSLSQKFDYFSLTQLPVVLKRRFLVAFVESVRMLFVMLVAEFLSDLMHDQLF